jgi:integrase
MRRPKAYPFRRDKVYWARVRYVDESGKTREKVARAKSAADARAKSIELVKRYEAEHGLSIDSPTPITFNKFADLFVHHIERQRSYPTTSGFLRTLRGYFGNRRLTSITRRDVERYAKERLATVSARTGEPLKKSSVKREIDLLSSMFKEAIEQGFAVKNPVKDGPPIIKAQEETKRDRILTEEEEERLLAVCTGRRAHLRAVIIAALDTGATKSQLLRLTWEDTKILRRIIYFRLVNGKTVGVVMSQRLADELAKLYEPVESEYLDNPSLHRGEYAPLLQEWIAPRRVFRDFKSSFPSACRAAEIKDLRFNDLRRTSALRYSVKIERFKARLASES